MKAWVMVVFATLGSTAAPAFAESGPGERCRLRVGHERPPGCALQKPRAIQPSTPQKPAKPAAAASRPPDEAWMEMLRYPKNWASQKQSTRLLMRELTRLERLLAVGMLRGQVLRPVPPAAHELPVVEPVLDQVARDREQDRRLGAGRRGQPEIRVGGGVREARVEDDHLRTVSLRLDHPLSVGIEVVAGLEVRADEQDDLRVRAEEIAVDGVLCLTNDCVP